MVGSFQLRLRLHAAHPNECSDLQPGLINHGNSRECCCACLVACLQLGSSPMSGVLLPLAVRSANCAGGIIPANRLSSDYNLGARKHTRYMHACAPAYAGSRLVDCPGDWEPQNLLCRAVQRTEWCAVQQFIRCQGICLHLGHQLFVEYISSMHMS